MSIVELLKNYRETNNYLIIRKLSRLLRIHNVSPAKIQELTGCSYSTACAYRSLKKTVTTRPELINVLIICEYLQVDPTTLLTEQHQSLGV